jgi:hypothetical protein
MLLVIIFLSSRLPRGVVVLSTTTSTVRDVNSNSERSSVSVDTDQNDDRYNNSSNYVYDDRGGSDIDDCCIDLSSTSIINESESTSRSFSTNDRKISRGKHRRNVENQHKQQKQKNK